MSIPQLHLLNVVRSLQLTKKGKTRIDGKLMLSVLMWVVVVLCLLVITFASFFEDINSIGSGCIFEKGIVVWSRNKMHVQGGLTPRSPLSSPLLCLGNPPDH